MSEFDITNPVNRKTRKYVEKMQKIAKITIAMNTEYEMSRKCIACKSQIKVEEDSNIPGWTLISFLEYMQSDKAKENYLYNYCLSCLDDLYLDAFPPGKDSRGYDI